MSKNTLVFALLFVILAVEVGYGIHLSLHQ